MLFAEAWSGSRSGAAILHPQCTVPSLSDGSPKYQKLWPAFVTVTGPTVVPTHRHVTGSSSGATGSLGSFGARPRSDFGLSPIRASRLRPVTISTLRTRSQSVPLHAAGFRANMWRLYTPVRGNGCGTDRRRLQPTFTPDCSRNKLHQTTKLA